jgi:hypothetical protein
MSIDGREEVVVLSRDGATPETLVVIAPAVVPLPIVAAVVMLRWLRLDEDLCRREGVGWLEPDR